MAASVPWANANESRWATMPEKVVRGRWHQTCRFEWGDGEDVVVGAVKDVKNVRGKSDESRYSVACLYGIESEFGGSICRAEGDEARGADVDADVVCRGYLARTDDDDL